MNDWEALGLFPSATEEEIKTAYRNAVKRTHPDMGGNPEDFYVIQAAYNRLMQKKPLDDKKPLFTHIDCPTCQGTGTLVTGMQGFSPITKNCRSCRGTGKKKIRL
jgi:DnaJ-class molecular chaperone